MQRQPNRKRPVNREIDLAHMLCFQFFLQTMIQKKKKTTTLHNHQTKTENCFAFDNITLINFIQCDMPPSVSFQNDNYFAFLVKTATRWNIWEARKNTFPKANDPENKKWLASGTCSLGFTFKNGICIKIDHSTQWQIPPVPYSPKLDTWRREPLSTMVLASKRVLLEHLESSKNDGSLNSEGDSNPWAISISIACKSSEV